MLPEGSSKPKLYAKRDVAIARKAQKERFNNISNEPGKMKKRARIETPVVDITATSTEEEISGKNGEEQRSAPDEKTGNAQNPEKATYPIKDTTKWEVEKPKEPIKRTSERFRMPTKRYGIYLIQLDTESEN